MQGREWLLRAARAACFATVAGMTLLAVFYNFRILGMQTRPSGIDTRTVQWELLPKPEEFSWLVGVLAFVALFLTPLPARHRLPLAGVRAVAGALAITLPVAAWDATAHWGDPWFTAVIVGVASAAGLFLLAVPLRRDA